MQDFGPASPPGTDAIGSVHSQAILDALPLPVFAIDAEYAIVPCNRAAAEHLRKRADASIGLRNTPHAEPRCHEILYGRSQICPYCPTTNELQSDPENDTADPRSGQDYEDIIEKVIPVRTPGGDERSIRLHFISLNTAEGSGLPTDTGTYQLIETLEDITIRQQKQEEALRMENLAALGIMISGIAHELNNPLTGIGLNLQNLQANLESMAAPEIQRRLSILQKDLHRASRIVSDILSFSSPGKPRLTRASIVQTIQKAIDNTMRLYPILSRQVQWKFQPDLDDEFFAYDTEKVERVLINLFRNSLQALDYQPGYVSIQLKRLRKFMRITIEDNAGGIPIEKLSRIFQPFYSSSGNERGSGLGLSICHSIIREHSGRIHVRSFDGKTRFYLSLPLGTVNR